jgi:hypothetical protein
MSVDMMVVDKMPIDEMSAYEASVEGVFVCV